LNCKKYLKFVKSSFSVCAQHDVTGLRHVTAGNPPPLTHLTADRCDTSAGESN